MIAPVIQPVFGQVIRKTDRTIIAMVDSLIEEVRPETDSDQRAMICAYILATVSAMPDYFRLAFQCLALLFDWWSVPRQGRRFHSLDATRRLRQIAAWRCSRLGFRRSFIAFFATFTTFGLYSEVYGQDYADLRADAA